MISGNKLIRSTVTGLRIVTALLLLAAIPLSTGAVRAGMGMAAAAAVGSSGLEACRTTSGKVLYDCVAGVLDRMSGTLPRAADPEVRGALQTAAAQLRAASNKAQALSAIAQCRSVFSGLIQHLRSTGGDAPGLSAIAGVLSKAAALIQSKG
jgi:hypothetical protein